MRARIQRGSPGMVIDVVADDLAAPLDLPAWCHLTGHEYLGPVTSTLGPAYAIWPAADAKPAGDRRPWVRRA